MFKKIMEWLLKREQRRYNNWKRDTLPMLVPSLFDKETVDCVRVQLAVQKDLDNSFYSHRRSGRTTTAIVERIRSENEEIGKIAHKDVMRYTTEYLIDAAERRNAF